MKTEPNLEEKNSALLQYKKLTNTLKSFLKGKVYHNALKAFDFAEKEHLKIGNGVRKDGKTPSFQHQVEICLFLITLKEVVDEENTIIAGLLHDVREDANIEHQVIETKFGKTVADAVEKLTKEFNGVKKSSEEYFASIATCPIASLVKLADRIHNFSSMIGVFSIEKQEHYVFEVKNYFLPLIKKSRNNFPEQHMSYHAMGTFLKNMLKAVEAVLLAENQLIEHQLTPNKTQKNNFSSF